VKVVGVSVVTNLAAGVSEGPLSHGEVKETADRARVRFLGLLRGMVPLLVDQA
jgi:purine-nucleoside phosphorylase